MGRVTVSAVLTLLAVVLFVFAALGVATDGLDELDLIAWGLAAYAFGRIVP